MADSDDDRTITGWRTASKWYRQPPGWGWLAGLLVVPLLLGLMGWSGLQRSDRDVDVALPSVDPTATLTAPNASAPSVNAPNVNAPAVSFAPLSIVRNGNGFTLTGDLPDPDMKTGLLDALRGAFGADVELTDNLNIAAGGNGPEFAGLGALFGAGVDIPNFGFDVKGDTVTLTGTAPSDEVKSAAEAAAKQAWPNIKVVNNIEVQAAGAPSAPVPPTSPAPGGACANLQADVNGLLRTPVTFATDGFSLAPASQQLLSQVADKLKACPNARVAVTGHTDNTGNDAINVPLSGNRAKSVADYLISGGVAGDHVTSEGVGAAEPIASNDTAAGRAENRRVAITVS
jgi:peptidoglycan-binding protein ArfA